MLLCCHTVEVLNSVDLEKWLLHGEAMMYQNFTTGLGERSGSMVECLTLD